MENICPNYTRMAIRPQVKASNKAEREVMHLISTDSVDRAGDIVEPGGADISNYLKNPVVLVDHDYRMEKVVGKASEVRIDDQGIWARTKFLDTPLGRDAFSLAGEGIGGWSIGFRPVQHESIKDEKGNFKGFRFKKWELLEYSLVAIPMNQDVVNNAVQRGLVAESNIRSFFEVEAPEPPVPSALPGANAAKASTTDFYGLQQAIDRALGRLARSAAAQQITESLRRIRK